MIRRFLSQPTMKLFRKANTDHPMSRPPLHHGEASDSRSKGDPIIRPTTAATVMVMATPHRTEIKRTITLLPVLH
jgi:hypothetical protein